PAASRQRGLRPAGRGLRRCRAPRPRRGRRPRAAVGHLGGGRDGRRPPPVMTGHDRPAAGPAGEPSAPYGLTARQLVAAFARRELSPVEAAGSCLDRIRSVDGAIGAFCLVDDESAIAAATASERRWQAGTPMGLLDGVPVAV